MKSFSWLCAAALAGSSLASPAQQTPAKKSFMSEDQILKLLTERNPFLPRAVHRRMVEKYKAGTLLSKRQIANTGSFLETIQTYGGLISSIPSILWAGSTAPYKGPDPKSLVPEITISSGTKFPEAKKVKVRYGPFRIPPQQEKNFNNVWWGVQGVATSFHMNVKRPCEEECTILGIEANLEYADGTPANTSTGAIFHHTVLLNVGPNVIEPTCGQPFIENIFMSGNERGSTDYAIPGGMKSGYAVDAHDTFMLNTELQNWTDKDKFVWETITYEIVEGTRQDYMPAKIVWLTIGKEENPSIGLCHYFNGEFPWGDSNLTARDQPVRSVFSEHSKIWRSDTVGKVLQAAGHLHDGGLSVDIYQNDQLFCTSDAKYEKGVAPAHSHGGGGKPPSMPMDMPMASPVASSSSESVVASSSMASSSTSAASSAPSSSSASASASASPAASSPSSAPAAAESSASSPSTAASPSSSPKSEANTPSKPPMKRQLNGGSYANTEIPHITELTRCTFPEGKDLRAGDALFMAANYDLDKYKGIKLGDGKIDMVMGMAGILVASKDL